MTENRYLQIAQFLKVARSFFLKVHKELENNDGQMSTVVKCKKHQQRSDRFRAHKFIQQVQNIIDQKLMRPITDLCVFEATIRKTIHENLRVFDTSLM